MSTPPPPQANPYADPRAANPYAEQVPDGDQWTAAPTPPKRSGRGRSIAIGFGIMVLAIGALFAVSQFSHGADTASVRDCVQNKGTDDDPDVKVIDCTDPKAEFTVLKTLNSTDMNTCDSVPGVTAAYSESAGSGDSLLLCLGKNTP